MLFLQVVHDLKVKMAGYRAGTVKVEFPPSDIKQLRQEIKTEPTQQTLLNDEVSPSGSDKSRSRTLSFWSTLCVSAEPSADLMTCWDGSAA